MKQDVKTILEDLYRIDSNFKKYEPELTKMVSELLASKPDTRFDQAFAEQLRAQLMEKQSESVQKYAYESGMSGLSIRSVFTLFDFRKIGYGVAGAFVALLVILPLVNNQMNSGLSLRQVINDTGEGSFGTLQPVADIRGAGVEMIEPSMTSESVEDMSVQNTGISAGKRSSPISEGEGVTGTAPVATMMAPMSAGSSAAPTTVAPSGPTIAPYQPQIVRYVYEGEPFTITETEGRVFMRARGLAAGKQMAELLKNVDFGLMNLGNFDNLQTRTIELAEDKDKGYAINVNFEEGVMYIMPNWQRWNYARSAEVSEQGVSIPDDSTLIAKANEFLDQHGIKTDIYSEPFVDRRQIEMYTGVSSAGAISKSSIMPHDMMQVSVIYPLTLSGKTVYDESGTPFGLSVSINVRENMVNGVNNLTSQLYDSSSYALETNAEKILAHVTGPNTVMPTRGAVIKNIRLGTPEQVLMKYWDYTPEGMGREMYVPALKFPVLSQSATPYYQHNIIVPIVKDILDSRGTPHEVMPMPMPMPVPPMR